jgi:hypothetical protein
MTTLTEWIVAGVGLSIGRLIMASAVILVIAAILAVVFIWEERTK